MIKIDRYETISTLILKQIKKGVITNNFLTKEILENEIANNSLYAYQFDGGLLLLRERKEHYILNYYINNIDINIDEDFGKDVVVEIVNRENDNNEKIISYFQKQEYTTCLKRVRYVNNFCGNVSCIESSEIQMCKSVDADEVMQIFAENFDAYTGCIPLMNSLLKYIENENIYVYKKEKVEGVLHVEKGKNSSEIKHLAVLKTERNKGIATKLVNKYMSNIDVKKKTVWTGEDNIFARKFYEKNGYQLDGYTSIVLKKKGYK